MGLKLIKLTYPKETWVSERQIRQWTADNLYYRKDSLPLATLQGCLNYLESVGVIRYERKSEEEALIDYTNFPA